MHSRLFHLFLCITLRSQSWSVITRRSQHSTKQKRLFAPNAILYLLMGIKDVDRGIDLTHWNDPVGILPMTSLYVMLFYQVLNRELIFLFANSAIIVAITVSPFDPLQPRKKTLARNTFVFIVFLPNRLVDPSITIHPLSYFHFAYDFPAQYLILNNNQKLINETIGRLFKINASTLSFTHRTELEQALWLLTFSVAMHDSNLRPSVDWFIYSLILKPLSITTADESRVSEDTFRFVNDLLPLLEIQSKAPVVIVRNPIKSTFCSKFAVLFVLFPIYRWHSRCPLLITRCSQTGFFCECSD